MRNNPLPFDRAVSSQAFRLDWFRMLADICRNGYSLYDLARDASVPRSTLDSYRRGSEPSHSVGSRLLIAWSIKTGRDPRDAPIENHARPLPIARR